MGYPITQFQGLRHSHLFAARVLACAASAGEAAAHGKACFSALLQRVSSFAALLLIVHAPCGVLFAELNYVRPYAFTTLVGSASRGTTDGAGSAARFNSPWGLAVDARGNAYVADSSNHTIRKITGGGLVTTLAGSPGTAGAIDGFGASARFNLPSAVVLDQAGNLYVADTYNHAIRKITMAGEVATVAGFLGVEGSSDGTGSSARFRLPGGVTVDAAGNLYVADTGNHTIRKITPMGVVTTVAGVAGGSNVADGIGTEARFVDPVAITVDAAGNLYVLDQGFGLIRKITPPGVVSSLAGSAGGGWRDGLGNAARFDWPAGIAVDRDGNLYVADQFNCAIRKVTSSGEVTTFAGTPQIAGSADGINSRAQFSAPCGIALDSMGLVWVADTGNNTIRKSSAAGETTTVAG